MYPILYLFSDYGILALRLALGLILVAHGWPKIKNLRGTGAWLASVGFRPGMLWAPVIAIVEFFGGLALVAGIGVQVVTFLIAGQFAVILVWKLIGRQPFVQRAAEGYVAGYEFDLIIFAAALALLTLGAGAWAIL